MENSNTGISYSEEAFLKQLDELKNGINDASKNIQSSLNKSIWDELDDEQKAKKKEQINKDKNFLSKAFDKVAKIKDDIAENIVLAGEILHSQGSGEKKNEIQASQIIKNLDITIEEEDFDALAIANYFTNTSISPTKGDSLTLAEANLIIAEKLEEQSLSAAKYALTNNAILPLIIEKNILKSEYFKKIYATRDNFYINEKILISALEKLKQYNKIKLDNEQLIFSLCDISIAQLSRDEIKESLNSYKETILNKSYLSNSLTNNSFLISNDDYLSIPAPKSDRNEIFIAFAKAYLKYELPDPENKLKNELNMKECTQANKIYSPSLDDGTKAQNGESIRFNSPVRLKSL